MIRTRRPSRGLLVSLALALVLPLAAGEAAAGPVAHPRVVSEDPVDYTPVVVDDAGARNATVRAVVQLGDRTYTGGSFRTVRSADGTVTGTRAHLMAFETATGRITGFRPNINGSVWGLAASGDSLYVVGTFTRVSGQARRGIVKVDARTGAVDRRFDARIPSGWVKEVRMVRGRLVVGGSFPKRLAALDPATGRDTGYLDLGIAGSVASNAGRTDVYRFAVDPRQTRLVAVGNFTSVSGQRRRHVFMVVLGTTSTRLHPWYYRPLDRPCRSTSTPAYMRDVDFAPDGSYFVLASTGFIPRTQAELGTALCDAAARFETRLSAPSRPSWVNYTGGDTLHSIAATGAAVYVQGHQRWLDNPFGRDNARTGAVSRPGIGAIDPVTGKALAWNPTKSREVGGRDMLATPEGLWVVSDGNTFAREPRRGIAFLPL